MSLMQDFIKITLETEVDGKLATKMIMFRKDQVDRSMEEIKDYLGMELVPIIKSWKK